MKMDSHEFCRLESLALHGFTVKTCDWMTVPGHPVHIRRTWRERLFSLPWRPIKAYRTEYPMIPDRQVVRANNVLYMHPDIWEEIKKKIEAK